MKVIKGDTVKVISGKERGKTGEVIKVFPDRNRVVIKDVNIITKRVRTNNTSEVVKVEASMDASNVMVINPETKKPTRIGYKVTKDKKERVYKK